MTNFKRASAVGLLFVALSLAYVMATTNVCSFGSAYRIKAESDIASIGLVIELYQKENGRLPESLSDLSPNYLAGVRVDPWENAYGYRLNEEGPVVFSYGDPKKKERIFGVKSEKI